MTRSIYPIGTDRAGCVNNFWTILRMDKRNPL